MLSTLLLANEPPMTPTINEPESAGLIVNPADVHMETGPFQDIDVGDAHLCSDWELRLVSTNELVWAGTCSTGFESIHSHLGDGVFVGSHAGRDELLFDTAYRLRVRHRDDSGEAVTEYSAWSERDMVTGPPTEIFPLETEDILDVPAPQWNDVDGVPVVLPVDATPARIRVENAIGELLLEIAANDGVSNSVTNPAILPEHDALRVRVIPGSRALALADTDLSFRTHEDEDVVVYLPAFSVAPGNELYYWISAAGSTYVGDATQIDPSFAQVARTIPVPWQALEAGYKVEVAVNGLRLPVNIAFVPNPGSNPGDPLYYVTELYGSVKVVTQDGTVSDYAIDLLNYTPSGVFPGSGEQGLTGIAVDPLSGDVFVSMLRDAGGPHYPRVVRLQSSDGGLTADSQTVLLDMVGEPQGQSHQISNVSIGPDGLLYVHMGDGFDSSTAQNIDSYRGKVLRMNLDGSAATNNPMYNAGDGINSRDYIYAYGLRNPFGGAWRAADSTHYQVENGPSVDRFSKILEGENYLWSGTNQSMSNFAIYNWNPATGPTNLVFVENATFGGSLFPIEKLEHMFVAESGPTWSTGPQSRGKRITEFVLDAQGDLVSGPTNFVTYVGTGKSTVCALAMGPDGMYFSELYRDQDYTGPTDGGARILRVKFVGAADFSVDISNGPAPLSVQFTDLSTVPSPTSWEWDFGDGNSSSAQDPAHQYSQDGIYTVRLSVTGSNGVVVETKQAFVRVGDFSRVAVIGGGLPASASDQGIADFLSGLGHDVVIHDDEPGNRPSAAVLANSFDLVVVSSTTLSSNIGGEFRNVDLPLIFWEQALLRSDRVPLAGSGALIAGPQITLVDNTHPITAGFVLGDYTVYNGSALISSGVAPLAATAQVLAVPVGATSNAALMTAEAGAVLLGGHVAPARRVFFFFDDIGWSDSTAVAEQLFERSVAWALGDEIADFVRGDTNNDSSLDISDAVALLIYLFKGGPLGCEKAADTNDDGALGLPDAIYFLNYLFINGPVLSPPTLCGADPTADALGCMSGCP